MGLTVIAVKNEELKESICVDGGVPDVDDLAEAGIVDPELGLVFEMTSVRLLDVDCGCPLPVGRGLLSERPVGRLLVDGA